MKTNRLTAFLFVIVIMGILTPAAAQRGREMRFRGSGHWGMGTRYEQLFDNNNVRAVTGTVVIVDTATPGGRELSMGPAMRVIVNIDGKEIPVHLGPMWFAIHQDIAFPTGERIEVRGFQTSFGKEEFIMATEIRSRNRIFRFRDEDGLPFWAVHRPR